MRGETFIAADYDVFAGLDVEKRSISVTLPITRIDPIVAHTLSFQKNRSCGKKVHILFCGAWSH